MNYIFMFTDAKVQCFGRSFKFLKDFELYVKDLIYNKIGLCHSVRQTDYFNDLHELLLRHPMADEKLEGMTDLCIEKNSYGQGYAVYILGLGFKRDISWRVCIRGVNKSYSQNLRNAMRYSIEDQIKEFRKNSNGECALCRYNRTLEVDNVIKLKHLVSQFLKLCHHHNIPIPE